MIITDTAHVKQSARGVTWDILSSFENLQSLEYTFTYGSHAQDLCVWPHYGVVFPKLEHLRMNMRNVEDDIPVHTRQIDTGADFGHEVYQALHPGAAIEVGLNVLGGKASVASRQRYGGSLYDDTKTDQMPLVHLGMSFPKLKTIHIRAGLSHYEDLVNQMTHPDGWGANEQEVDLTFEVVRGLGGSYSCIPLNVFPRCRTLTVRGLHNRLHPHVLGECPSSPTRLAGS